MNTGTFQTKDIPKTNTGPLRMLHTTITALVIAWNGLDHLQVAGFHLLRHDDDDDDDDDWVIRIKLTTGNYRIY